MSGNPAVTARGKSATTDSVMLSESCTAGIKSSSPPSDSLLISSLQPPASRTSFRSVNSNLNRSISPFQPNSPTTKTITMKPTTIIALFAAFATSTMALPAAEPVELVARTDKPTSPCPPGGCATCNFNGGTNNGFIGCQAKGGLVVGILQGKFKECDLAWIIRCYGWG
ncbi:hypothetical protein LTS18_003183 [Coniosporium uncinatum]|uniref:Uncharacterized protein n=1 Tax=Coniosporium uncinatum TaxID=93489 RepID=A0ACC3D750_9PEZI|nr:hypothetical protein LTS18_003183 [Coniosporium uncinatum]